MGTGTKFTNITLEQFLLRHREVFDPTLGQWGDWREATSDDLKALEVLFYLMRRSYQDYLMEKEGTRDLDLILELSDYKKEAAKA